MHIEFSDIPGEKNTFISVLFLVFKHSSWKKVSQQAVYWLLSPHFLHLSVWHATFHPLDISGNVTLAFPDVSSQNQMILANKKDKIYINCTGPYVLYVRLCYLDFLEANATGTLQLQVVGKEEKTPFSFPTLYATAHEVCRVLHDIVYLSKKNEASLHLISSLGFKIKHARVGLSYLLGSQCVYQWEQVNALWRRRHEDQSWLVRGGKKAQHSCSSAAVRTDTLSRTHADGMICVVFMPRPKELRTWKSHQLVHDPGQEQIIWLRWWWFLFCRYKIAKITKARGITSLW